jgi:hypothetical protein
MAGLGILFIIGLYLSLTVLAMVKVKPIWLKGLVLLLALLIPTADAVYGRYKLKQMCEAEAGLKIYRVAHGVKGFMGGGCDGYMLKRSGYQFTEDNYSYTYNKGCRATLRDGDVVIEDNVKPKSKYRFSRREIGDTKDVYLQSQYLIEEIDTGEILATDTQFGFNGGWAERLIAAFGGGGISPTWCSYTVWMDPIKVLNASLKQ